MIAWWWLLVCVFAGLLVGAAVTLVAIGLSVAAAESDHMDRWVP